LANNALCGLYEDDEDDIILDNGELRPQRGTYTTEGIAKLCEGLKGSAVTSLECAAAPKVSCQRPLTPPFRVLAVLLGTNSAPKEEPLSLTGSRATRR